MMIWILAFFISLLLDGYLSNFFPYFPWDLSWFTPFFTFSILMVFVILKKKMTFLDWGLIFLCGFLFDCFYTNYFFIHGIIFLLCLKIAYDLIKRVKINFWIESILFIFLLFLNQFLLFAFLFISSHFSISILTSMIIFLKQLLVSFILFHIELKLVKRKLHKN